MEPKVIVPTVGRVVLFVPDGTTAQSGYVTLHGERLAATVAYVHGDRMVNLSVVDSNGKQFARTSVPLRQPGDPVPVGDYCEWMPHQIQTAAKQAAFE